MPLQQESIYSPTITEKLQHMNAPLCRTSVNMLMRRKIENIALWAIQALVAGAFVIAGCSEFSGDSQMAGAPAKIAGSIEIILAVLVLIPRMAIVGAGLIISTVAAAALAHWTLFHTSPSIPITLGVLSAVILWGRRSPETAIA
jgi:uncharacterized membrane protein YphA (DoxX/SURF4 family)